MWLIPVFLFVLFIVCCVIQFRAMNRIAFGRSIFISTMFLLMGFIVAISSMSPARYVSWFLFVCGYGFLLFMTVQSVLHVQKNKQNQRKKTIG